MPNWIRVRDTKTGHEFDLHERDVRLRDGRVEVVENYPPNSGSTARPRPAKHRVAKSGRPARKQAEKSADKNEE